MDNFESIETAPKDGTMIWLRNSLMDEPVLGHWGELWDNGVRVEQLNWVSDFTMTDKFRFPAGRLVCPSEWAPVKR